MRIAIINFVTNRCSSGDWTKNMATSFIQSVATGQHAHCPVTSAAGFESKTFSYEKHLTSARLGQIVNIIDEEQFKKDDQRNNEGAAGISSNQGGQGVQVHNNSCYISVLMRLIMPFIIEFQVVESSQVLFSLETLIITVSAGAVAALVVGFVTGYCCGRKCRKEDMPRGHGGMMPYPDTEYEYFEQRGGLARPIGLQHTIGPGAPLLPTQPSKLNDTMQEEVLA